MPYCCCAISFRRERCRLRRGLSSAQDCRNSSSPPSACAQVEEHNKKVFHQQMLETGNSLLFDDQSVRNSLSCFVISRALAFAVNP